MSSAKANLSAAVTLSIVREDQTETSGLWQPRLALLSHFSCPDNERPNLRSRRLLVVFPAKANSLALAIFKQRIPISGWFYNSTVKFFLHEVTIKQMNGQSYILHLHLPLYKQAYVLGSVSVLTRCYCSVFNVHTPVLKELNHRKGWF